MKIILGADHGGFNFKSGIATWLKSLKHEVVDVGADHLDPNDDYPPIAAAAARIVAADSIGQTQTITQTVGILLCKSGAGMAIAANKIDGIRAAEADSVQEAIHAREHNHANILTLSAEWLDEAKIKEIILAFLNAQPLPGRHDRRVAEISTLES